MIIYQHVILLIAGISFFLYGMSLASENLQIIAADGVRQLMSKIANHRFLAILSGVALAVLLQSSGAVTVLLVNLASAGIVTLTQVMGVMIGATVGTTITVQLLSFNVTGVALYLIIIGFGVLFLSKRKKYIQIGKIIFGFGLIFYGLLLMGEAISYIRDVPAFKSVTELFNQNPIVAFIFATAFTAIVQSSAVTVGLAMALALKGVISIYDSMFWVYGANLGTTATALLASLSGSYLGRQVAWAHFFYKAASISIIFLFTRPIAEFISHTGNDAAHQIANAHTFFNIFSAIIFFPFINKGAKFIEKIFPRPLSDKEFRSKYLDAGSFASPAKAFANAIRETIRMADYALEMVRLSPRAFEKDDPNFIDDIGNVDKKIDILNREIKLYLVRLADENLSQGQHARVVNLIALVSDIETIGDVIDRNVISLASKKSQLKITFSREGWREVLDFHQFVVENFELALSAFSLNNRELAEKVIDNKHKLRLMEQKLRETHIERLHQKNQDSFNTSNIHLDLLSAYRRVNSYVCNLVYPVIYSDSKGFFPAGDTPPESENGTDG
jgi:phosphate:Na+ symporter